MTPKQDIALEHAVEGKVIYLLALTVLVQFGYLPISWWARSIGNLEMVAGGLYLTIVISRLVGLYKSEKQETPK